LDDNVSKEGKNKQLCQISPSMEKKELKSCSKGNKVVAFDAVSKTLKPFVFSPTSSMQRKKTNGENSTFSP